MHAPFHPNGRAPSPVVSTRRGFLGRCAGFTTWASPDLGAGLLAGCGGGLDSSAYLRFCHTGVDDGTADFWVAGSRVVASLANGGTVSSWLQGDAGSVALAWHAAGSSSARLTETRSLTEDSHTSVVSWGTLASSLKFRYLAETNSAAASGSVKLRGLHAAPSIVAVDVFVTNSSSLDAIVKELPLDAFPSPEDLWRKYKAYKGLSEYLDPIIAQDYFSDGSSRSPRYYQQIAINRTVEAVARKEGNNRHLLVMATGTGKTYTAFQIIYRLWKSGQKKRILFLPDRSALIDQTVRGDFRHFKDAMTVIKHKQIDTAYNIYLALYQGLSDNNDIDAYKQFSPEFFDLIVVDECHRGSAAI